jgi:hypothetical protein
MAQIIHRRVRQQTFVTPKPMISQALTAFAELGTLLADACCNGYSRPSPVGRMALSKDQ